MLDGDPVRDREAGRADDADDPDPRSELAQRDRDPGREAAAADRDQHRLRVRCLLRQLEPDRALARDDAPVLEGVDEGRARPLDVLLGRGDRSLEALAHELHLSVVGARGLDLRHRRVLGHEDRRGDPGLARSPRDRLPVVPRARRHHARRPLLRSEGRDRVVRAADLERPGALEVLGLEQDLAGRRAARTSPRGRAASRARPRRGARGRPRCRRSRVPSRRGQAPRDRPVSGPSSLNTFSMISRTAVSGSSSRRWTDSRSLRSSAIVGDGLLEAPLGTARRDREHLRGEVPPPALLEPTVALERSPVLLELRPQLGDVLAPERLREDDRRTSLGLREPDDRAHLAQHRLRGRVVHLVDRDHVRDLHDPRLQRLHGVARPRHEHEQHGVGDPGHLDLALAGADRLHEDDVLPRRVEQEDRLQRRLREASEVTPRPHRADVDAGVEEVVAEADAIAEERTARERARGVDGDDADRPPGLPDVRDESGDERRLAGAGRPGDPDDRSLPRLGVELADERVRDRIAVLDERDRARQRPAVAVAHAGDELLERPLPPRHDAPLYAVHSRPVPVPVPPAVTVPEGDCDLTTRSNRSSSAASRARAAARSPRGARRSGRDRSGPSRPPRRRPSQRQAPGSSGPARVSASGTRRAC